VSRKILNDLGFYNILNVGGHFTVMGGSCPDEEVMRSMEEASHYWIDMRKLQVDCGKLLSRNTGCDDGIITSGAYAANIIAAETALSFAQYSKKSLPTPNIIIQKSHITRYAESFTTSGIRLLEIEKKKANDSISDHINDNTIALAYVINESEFEFDLHETVDVARKAGLPIIVDAAVVAPPIRGIKQVQSYNPDCISVSGGKGFNGPNGSGLLLGQKTFISKARELAFPNYGPGRGMKVSKEQIAGLMTAIVEKVEMNENLEIERWKQNIETIRKYIENLDGIRTEVVFPWRLNFPQPVPRLLIHIERETGAELADKVRQDLMQGKPAIFTRPLDQLQGPKNKLLIDARLVKKSQLRIVGERLRICLKKYLH
jgi:D-glucosaminate-6-phosphate ammonia-lyase